MHLAIGQLRQFISPAFDDDEGAVEAAPTVPLREIVRRFWPDARPFRRWLAPWLLFVALGPALDTATIWLYGLLVDDVLVPRNFGLFPQIALAYLGLTLLGGLIAFADDTLSAWVSERFLLELRARVYTHMQRLPLGFFAGRRRGDLVARLTDDVDDVEALLISGVADLLSTLLRVVFFAGAIIYLSWRLALLALVVAPLFWLASRAFSRRLKAVSREERRRDGAINAVAEEGLANMALVQAYNLEAMEADRFAREARGNFAAQMALTRARALFAPLLDLFELGAVLVVAGAGVWELAQGNITLGGLLVFLTYLSQLLGPVRELSQLIGSFASAAAGAERVIELLDEPPAIVPRRDAIVPAEITGRLRFEGVSFRYPGVERQALRDISFEIAPGQTLAVVGASGAGKSTVGRLLLRFHESSAGRILLDGHDLRDLDASVLRNAIAVVLQESLVVSGTVGENIALGRPGASEAEVVAAAQAADAHGFISTLPEGYDTVIGQGGATLSGGQRQRLAIARAMIRDAPVLVLDEPTTGLDAASTARVMAPMRRLMAGRAAIIISHNLQTTREADEIIVLDEGRIIERGTHASLFARGGAYARMYRLQHGERSLANVA